MTEDEADVAGTGLVLERLGPADLHAVARDFLVAHEAEHSLMLGLAARLRDEPATFRDPYLAVVRSGGGIRLVALRTPPFHLVLSMTDDPSAVDLVAEDLARIDPGLFGVNGPAEVARRFVAAWADRAGGSAALDMRARVYRLDRVIKRPTSPAGHARFATAADASLLAGWVDAFRAEALPNEPNSVAGADVVARWLARPDPVIWVWEDGGKLVSMAVAGGRTPNGVRIGSVYTPPADRRRGYASALMAAASQGELDRGRSFCFLDADEANPTSNHVYEAIGYRGVANVEVYRFVPRRDALPVE